MLEITLASLAGIFTAIISAVVGMAGGVIFLSLLTFFYSYEALIPIHGAVQLASNASRVILLKQHLIRPIIFYHFIGVSIGSLLSYLAIKSLLDPKTAFLLIILTVVYTIFKPKSLPEIRIPYWGYSIVGIATGFLAPIIGVAGIIQSPFYIRKDFTREQIISTQASTQAFTHFMKIPIFIAIGFDYIEYLPVIFILSLSVFIGAKIGIYFLKRISDECFFFLVKAALLVSTLRLSYSFFYA